MSAVAGRRTYTEDELQAALRDIQSGKLGTRRAAVIYGIPRSTLRNKVYKLAMERERETHLNPSMAQKMEEDEGMDDDRELSGAEEEKEVEKALQEPLLSMSDILRFSSNMDTPEVLQRLLQTGKEGQSPWAGLEHSSIGPYIQGLMLASGGLVPKPDGDHLNPMIPELVRRMIAEDRQLLNGDAAEKMSPTNSALATDKIKQESPDMDDDAPSNVILRIPSFRPTTSKNGCDLYRSASEAASPPVTSDSGSPPIMPGKGMMSLRDVIAKSISQKFQQSPEPLKMLPGAEYKRAAFTPPLGGMSVIKNHQDMMGRPYPHPPKPQHAQPNSSSQATGGKGTRPKRGKYRNYDRDSLVEAVRAVQRGEMSVHRAGSYYGVPHSTLEYKVKERHLMRPRKRDPKPNPVDEKIASMKSQEAAAAAAIRQQGLPPADKSRAPLKPPQKYPPTSPNGMKIPPIFDPSMGAPLGYTPPPFPFWPHPGFHHIPLDYARSPSTSAFAPNPEQFFAASQMMQRLQEDASRGVAPQAAAAPLPKNARQMAESLLGDGSGANGSFLDGIIRSSLESGVPGADEKKREDKSAPEHMSNKALLDQLCRNSRLAPLCKADTGAGSSGDESYKSADNHRMQTIELSNDSNDDSAEEERNGGREEAPPPPPAPPRIYVKQQFQELTKPENLKPEAMVRAPLANGCETGSASADMEQD